MSRASSNITAKREGTLGYVDQCSSLRSAAIREGIEVGTCDDRH